MRSKKRFSTTLVIVLLASLIAAQTGISDRVSANSEGTTIAGAKVKVDPQTDRPLVLSDFKLLADASASTETELNFAVDAIAASPEKSGTITLASDITLTSPLYIPDATSIVLKGPFKLIGVDWSSTIVVHGSLEIDGITVTHVSGSVIGTKNPGVTVFLDASFTFTSGSITQNRASGVLVRPSARFVMNGGEITSNHCGDASGGGVINEGSFVMNGGTIKDNSSNEYGGAIFNTLDATKAPIADSDNASFTMNGGTISNNSAGKDGGAIWSDGLIALRQGAISDNTATGQGGGIYTKDYGQLSVSQNAVFSSNRASEIYLVTPVDSTVYGYYISNVAATIWSTPLLIGYNNYDINYGYDKNNSGVTSGTTITYDYNYVGSPNQVVVNFPANSALKDCKIASPERPGYTFLGWRQGYPDGSTLDENTTTTIDPRTLYALWAPVKLDTNGPVPYNVIVEGYYNTPKTWADFYFSGSEVGVDAGVRPGYTFMGWTINYGDVHFYNGRNLENTFVMPAEDVKITAMWAPANIVPIDDPKLYSLVVHDSYAQKTWADFYFSGLDVAISAGVRTGYTFHGWRVDSHNITLAETRNNLALFDMPASDVEVTALWAPAADTPQDPTAPTFPGEGADGDSTAIPNTGDVFAPLTFLVLAQLLIGLLLVGIYRMLWLRELFEYAKKH